MGTLERIAIFLPNWVGDVVMASPALSALRGHFADAHITHVGRPAAIDTLGPGGLCDQTLIDRSTSPPKITNFIRQVRAIRAGRFGWAILLPNSFRSAWLARFGGIKKITGYSRDGRGFLLSDRLAPPRDADGKLLPISAVDYYIALARFCGAEVRSRRLTVAISDQDRRRAGEILNQANADADRPAVMLNPGASFGVSKMWDPRRFAELADRLIEARGVRIIINSAPGEKAIARRVATAMRHAPAVNLTDHDMTIGLLKAMLELCHLCVTNDTGARHLSAAVGVGVVTIFGSTDPRWSAIDYPFERLIRVDVPCGPCQRPVCDQPAGPAYHRCMSAINVEMVLPAAMELLDTTVKPSPGRKIT